MTGFSAEWLHLREPADHAARDKGLLAKVAAVYSGQDQLSILDLGCGAGSNLRGTAPHLLAARQSWTLVDYDPALLKAAHAALSAWADTAEEHGEELILTVGDKTITVDFRQVDLATDLERALNWRPDLVTAAALFDLVSEAWIARFATALAARGLPLYTVLIYDGTETWSPPHPADEEMIRAFHAHQARDKGFGPAAGPLAGPAMARAFAAHGYTVGTTSSPWTLGPAQAELMTALAEGAADAARETGLVPAADLENWRVSRRSATACKIGHMDLFARP